MYENFSKLLEKNHLKAADVCRGTGLPSSFFSEWKKGKSKPKVDKLQKIADYFDVSLEYLMTGKEKKWEPTLTENDEKDIQIQLENTLNQLENGTGLMFDGKIMDENTKELLKDSLEFAMRNARLLAKEKYTPKKYQK